MGGFQHRGAAQLALGGHADQAFGHFANTLFQAGLFGLPCAAAQPVEQPLFVAKPREQFDVFNRQIQLGAFGIFQQQTFMRRPRGCDHLEPQKPPHAMIDMHHQIARRQRLRLGQEIIGLAAFLGRADQPVAQNILFGNHRHIGGFIALLERPNRQMQPVFAHSAHIAQMHSADQALVADQPIQPLARALGIRGHNHRPFFHFCANMICQRLEKA